MVLYLRCVSDVEGMQGEGLPGPRLLFGARSFMRYICTFQDDGGNEVSLLSEDADSESDAVFEVGERLKKTDPTRTWSPLYCEVHES